MEVTDAAGRVVWTFPSAHAVPPVVSALPVDPAPGDATTVVAVLESVTATQATIRVWQTQPPAALGDQPAVPAGAGLAVHVVAVARS
ncbi:hypothetical protein F0L17_14345 [Streptomyces sp. TRM43335]|uniref:Uncharacterized protein n=1 Tax=Streptomyces taklimakanensis TaxID=2569853 RepID=A0A6G2BDB7_9ACTN|nr:hypothetical protein [Streptomyces taklimakanensis]MTE20267.1 hypothetical protein [Streptomyces taklimakanensis]